MSSVGSCTTPSTNPSISSTPPQSSSNSGFSLQSPPQIHENPPSHIISVNQLNYYVPQNVIGNARGVPVYQATFSSFGYPHLMVVAIKQIFQEIASYGVSVAAINKNRIVSPFNTLLVSVKEEVQHQGQLWLAFEYAGPSLRSVYPQGASLPAISWSLYNVVSGLVSIHQCGMVHCELNAGRIYMSEFNGVQICKVGFGATVYEYGQSPETPPGFLPIGDVCLWASPPEVYKSNTDMSLHTSASDIWQLGVTALELAWGSNLRVRNRDDLVVHIEYAIGGLEDGPNGVFRNANFQKFLSDCLKEEPAQRPTSQQLLNHEFFRRY